MDIPKKRLPNGFELPVLGIGTCLVGGLDYGPADYSKDKENVDAIRFGLELGYTHIDTAEMYGGNHTEELVGEAIKGYERKKLFITTKVSPENLGYSDLLNSANNSLKRLGIDYIDLYLLHRPNPNIPIEETMKAMNEMVKIGKVRYIGVSMFNIEQIKEAQRYAKYPIVANQMKYSLWKDSDLETINWCQKNNIMVIAYKVFGRGKLTTHKLPIISNLAKKHNKTESQIILNWVTSKENMVAIFKSLNSDHLRDNLKIFDFKLTKKELLSLDESVPPIK